jgi:hypothetical protein
MLPQVTPRAGASNYDVVEILTIAAGVLIVVVIALVF